MPNFLCPGWAYLVFAQIVEKFQVYFFHTGQLPLTWYKQSLCRFLEVYSTEHIEKSSTRRMSFKRSF